ncbi:MAG TPA: hypothetical protein VGB74_05095 [Actinoplanes sp.]
MGLNDGDTSDFFQPAPTRPARRRAVRHKAAASIVVVLLVVALVLVGWQTYLNSCRGFAWPDRALTRSDGECIGWYDEKAFAYFPGIADITDRIASENRRVSDTGNPYVRVAVFMPLTARDLGDAMTPETIRHSLEGAHVAQLRANTPAEILATAPLIQLVPVNIGRDQKQWSRMLPVVSSMARAGKHPLVAAVGLGVSLAATKEAADALSELPVPAVGAVITANNVTAKNMFVVSPSNLDYVNALREHITATAETAAAKKAGNDPPPISADRKALKSGTAILVYDTTEGDNYATTLADSFRTQLPGYLDGREVGFKGSIQPNGEITADFGPVRTTLCLTEADMIFYAGRDRDLTSLITAVATRKSSCKTVKKLTILTGATGLAEFQRDQPLQDQMRKNDITVIDASATYARRWLSGAEAPPGFDAFRTAFEKYAAATRQTVDVLDDGYLIMHHDAVLAVVTAARTAVIDQKDNKEPVAKDVLRTLRNLNVPPAVVRGASGDIGFNGTSGWPHGKPVPIIEIPEPQQAAAKPPPVYLSP